MTKPVRTGAEPDSAAKSAAEPGFEQALAELEQLVEKIEDGGLSLEESLAVHRRGVELAKQCRLRLEAAQQQVSVLEGESLKPTPGLAAASGEPD